MLYFQSFPKKPSITSKQCSESTNKRKKERYFPLLSSLLSLPIKSRIEFQILHFTYKVLNNQVPPYCKDPQVPCYLYRAINFQTAGLHVFPTVPKSRMGGKAFSCQAPPLGTSSQFGVGAYTPSLLLRLNCAF